MNRKLYYVIILLVAVFAFAGIYYLYDSLSGQFAPNNVSVAENNKNPSSPAGETDKKEHSVENFTVYDSDGNSVELWDLVGKPIILNFWASWCGPCVSEMPHFEEAYAKNTDVQFIMVNVTVSSYETLSKAKQFISDKGYSFPVFYDTTGEASEKYKITAIPMTFLIDKNGELAGTVTGSMSKDDLYECISIVKGEDQLKIE